MYDLEISTRDGRRQFEDIPTAGEARELVELTFAAWGVPVPPLVKDVAAFTTRLFESGEYTHADIRIEVNVRRSP